jgi:cbb3-type cytochrome oxidase maturation protein
MDILYLLIPLSAVLVLAIIGVFGWALHRGQFEDLEFEGERILDPPEPQGVRRPVDDDQSRARAQPEQSAPKSEH